MLQGDLGNAVKELTLYGLNMLMNHNARLAQSVLIGVAVVEKLAEHTELLHDILDLLRPLFGVVDDWIKKEHPYLWDIFSWAQQMWNSLFGNHKPA